MLEMIIVTLINLILWGCVLWTIITRLINFIIDANLDGFAKKYALIFLNEDARNNEQLIAAIERLAKTYAFKLQIKTLSEMLLLFPHDEWQGKELSDLETHTRSILFAVNKDSNELNFVAFSDLNFGLYPFNAKILWLLRLGRADIARLKVHLLKNLSRLNKAEVLKKTVRAI